MTFCTYPDGSVRITPSDGAVFTTDSGEVFEFDSTMNAWVRGYNRAFATSAGDIFAPLEFDTPPALVCQCGKDKHGFASHATWCDIAGSDL